MIYDSNDICLDGPITECFTEDEFLKTGDRGELDAQGRLKITGRVKELFKTSKGKYIAPAPIENIINNDSHIELSMVSGSGNPQAHAVGATAPGSRTGKPYPHA